MSGYRIDVDAETIEFDGQWLDREALAGLIRERLDAGNYAVGRHGAALELLNAALADVRTVAFRAAGDLADLLTDVAAQGGRTPGSIIREALELYLGSAMSMEVVAPEPTDAMAAPSLREPEGRRETIPEMAIPTLPPNLPPKSAFVAGPGALRNAGVGAVSGSAPSVVVDRSLSDEEKAGAEATSLQEAASGMKPETNAEVEQRWFGG